MNQRTLLLLCLVVSAAALAEDAKARAAREELERQLSQMVGQRPAKVRIDYAGLDEPNYQIEEASFELDGRSLRSPLVSQLSDEGRHLVWNGEVPAGKHTVKVLLVFVNATSAVLSDEGGYKWRVGGSVTFDVQAGIEVGVVVTPSRDAAQRDLSKRFKLALPAQPVMLARVDDGKMPEPIVQPVVLAAAPDAGAAPPLVAAVTVEPTPRVDPVAQAKALAAEEKKRKAEAAAEAKRLVAEEKKRKAEEAAEAKRLAAEEKKRKAEEAAEARRLAAEEKKRQAAEALEAKRLAAELALRGPDAAQVVALGQGTPEAADAGVATVAVAEPVDAGAAPEVDSGTAEAVVRVEPDAGAPVAAAAPTVTEASDSSPWFLLAGAGGIALIIVLIMLARRSARPPTLDD